MQAQALSDIPLPDWALCPIKLRNGQSGQAAIMKDPIINQHGISYQGQVYAQYQASKTPDTDLKTGKTFLNFMKFKNENLKQAIDGFLELRRRFTQRESEEVKKLEKQLQKMEKKQLQVTKDLIASQKRNLQLEKQLFELAKKDIVPQQIKGSKERQAELIQKLEKSNNMAKHLEEQLCQSLKDNDLLKEKLEEKEQLINKLKRQLDQSQPKLPTVSIQANWYNNLAVEIGKMSQKCHQLNIEVTDV